MVVDILMIGLKVAFMLGLILNLAGLLTWVERKQSALMQDRIGPNRANIGSYTVWGLFHPIADAIKLIMKENFIPARGNRIIHSLAPFIALFPALVTYAVIPFGDTVQVGNRQIPLIVADLNVGVLYIFAFSSLAVYGVMLAGWASHNSYSLLGGLRSASQMISYEVAMGLAALGVLMVYGSVELDEIVRRQGGFLWGVLLQPVGFILFLGASIAETRRAPFDLPEGESEIIGYFIEYSGMKFGTFFLAEFADVVVASALLTTLFFGGWQIPLLPTEVLHVWVGSMLGSILQVLSFVLKVAFFCWFLLLVRWTFPRFRYDQLMRLGWKYMVPLALANVFITGFVILAFF